jgi:hypothetical protein
MTLNSYRDPELRDRRSVFARHPLSTALGVVVGAFLLLVPIAGRFGHSDHVVVRTASLPGGVIDAGVFVEETTTTTVGAAAVLATTVVPITTATTSAPDTTEAPVATTATTVRKQAVATTVRRPATTAAKPKPTTTVKPKTATTAAKPAATTATTAAKTTTTTAKATTTTTVAPPTAYSAAQSEAVIRQVWPDDLEAQAVAIATRESNLHNVAHNYCCYGLFQINFTPHQQWLATLGVTRPEQLYDPTVNATVAYRLYLVSGWAPWGG